MKYLRLAGIALLAIFALSAIAANAANAAEASALITYSGSGAFTITSGPGNLELSSGAAVIHCEADNGTGQLGGKGGSLEAKTAELTVTFTECGFLGKKCTTTGLTAGNIQTSRLTATFGRIKPGVAGALLKPRTGTQFLVETKCGGTVFTVTGSIIGEFSTVDKQTSTLTLKFAQTKGLQAIKTFELGVKENNNLVSEISGSPEQAGLESEETLTLVGGSGILLA
jgi:hypothetical protein